MKSARGGAIRFWPAFVVGFVTLSLSALVLGGLIGALKLHLKKMPIEAPDGIKLHTLPSSFPSDKPRWEQIGGDDIASAEAAAELGTDNYLTRRYRRVADDAGAGREGGGPMVVQVHIAYYTGMIDTVPHVPERCMVGGGMEYAGATESVPMPLDFDRLTVDPDAPADDLGRPVWMGRSREIHRRVRLPRGIENLQLRCTPFQDQEAKVKVFAGYFFIANGGVVSSANDVRLLAFKLQDDYAYYTKVQFLSSTVSSAQELAAVVADMLDDLFPEIMRRVPDWIEVQSGRYPPDNPRRTESQEQTTIGRRTEAPLSRVVAEQAQIRKQTWLHG